MTGDPEKDSAESAIDADFEPAPAADYVLPKDPKPRGGPGWLPFGLVSVLAVGALGMSAISLTRTPVDASGATQTELSQRIDTLRAALFENKEEIQTVRESVSASEERMAAEIKALLSGDENGEGLETLVAELEAVSSRLDDAMSGSGDSEALEAIEQRLSALEDVGDATAATPGEAINVLSSLRERVESLEAENKAIAESLEDRTKALDTVTARIEDMEFALQSGARAQEGPEPFEIADLQAEIENLKTTIERSEGFEEENKQRFTEMLSGLEMVGEAEQKADQAKETATAALALSRIEAAAREGRSFHAAFKQLNEALPNDAAVKRLAPIARSGAPTMRQLTQQFAGDRDAALGSVDESADDGWGWTRQVFGGGVKVRRASVEGGPRDLLERAEQALEAGDLQNAIDALENLPEEPKRIMEDWTANAKARLTLQDALDDVGVRLIGRDR